MIHKKKALKSFIVLAALFLCFTSQAQTHVPNMPEHDSKLYYFGLSFGFNYSSYKVNNTQSFAEHDTFKLVQPGFGPGFHIGIMGNLRLTKFVDLRFIPALVFAEKKLKLVDQSDVVKNVSIESIYMQLPLQFKFKSDRIGNFRFYGLVGGKFDYDLASNARSRRQDELIRVSSIDVGAEVGIGFEFFYPNFIFAPEIKLSQGFINSHYPDSNIPLSNTIDAMRTRMIVFSIHLQG
jgi:hypothetical protein